MKEITNGVYSILLKGEGLSPLNNIYCIEGNKYSAIIDPGFGNQEIEQIQEIESAILSLHAKKPVRWVLLTDWYDEHISGANRVKALTDAQISCGNAESRILELENNTTSIDKTFSTGDFIDLGDKKITAYSTPGHSEGSTCFFIEKEGLLFSGDCIIPTGTTAINPSEGGDMSDYIKSLNTLHDLKISSILSFHGDPINNPSNYIENLIRTRYERDNKILEILENGEKNIAEIWNIIYGERKLEGYLIEASKKQILAHLMKLELEEKVLALKSSKTYKKI